MKKQKEIPCYELILKKHKPGLKIKELIMTNYDYGSIDNILCLFTKELKIHKKFTEHLFLICMNNQNKIIGIAELSHGSQTDSLLPIRELLIILLLSGAKRFCLIHNHPDAPASMSVDDNNAVARIKLAICNLEIEFVDSIVVSSDESWNSYELENEFC